MSGFRVRDGHHPQTGSKALNFYEATEVSCNIWYALAGMKTGGEAFAAMAARLGFGGAVPFDLPIGRSQLTNGGGNFAPTTSSNALRRTRDLSLPEVKTESPSARRQRARQRA